MCKSADDYFDDANLHEVHDRMEKAIECYNRAIEIRPHFPEAYFNRGGDWEMLGNIANAIADYKTSIEQMPEEPITYRCLAQIYLDADHNEFHSPKLAMHYAKQACDLTGNQCFQSLATYARACVASGQDRLGAQQLSLAVQVASERAMDNSDVMDVVDQINARELLPELEKQLGELQATVSERKRNDSLLGRIKGWFQGG